MQSPKEFLQERYHFFYYFFIYSFIGWLFEKIVVFISFGEFQPRGFVFGPFCIIYGFITLLLIKIFSFIKKRVLTIFLASTFIISAVEYVTGFLMEAIFNKRWWDYSNISYNLNGYICLKFSVAWGIVAILFIYFIHPMVTRIISQIPKMFIYTCCYILTTFFIVDFVFSFVENINIIM